MKWILIALLVWPKAQIVGTAPFNSESECEEARARVQQDMERATLICVSAEEQDDDDTG